MTDSIQDMSPGELRALAAAQKATIAALEAEKARGFVPEGFVLVPDEPTPEMLEAGDGYQGTPATYRAMIRNAPKACIETEFSQFLSAVMDAAGLVRHGRQSKELSDYLGDMCIKYRTAAIHQPSPAPDVADWKTKRLASALYQACGAYDMPDRVLDALSAAANGQPFAHLIDAILPCNPAPAAPDVAGLVEALETCLEMEERPKIIQLARAALATFHREG
mgnify:CR=1 FL=1